MVEAEVDPENLRRLLLGLKEFPPKVRTDRRRELRGIGDGIIAQQRAILDGPLPTGVAKVGQGSILALNPKTGKLAPSKRNIYADVAVGKPGRSSGLREGIKAGLKTRIVIGKTRQGIEIATTGPKVGSPQFNQAKFWQKAQFRHPVFGQADTYVYQKGQPYFFDPAIAGRDVLLEKAAEILTRAIDEI